MSAAREEQLRLVTDFAELRAGMLIEARLCGECGGTHRGILTRFQRAVPGDGYRDTATDGWLQEPGHGPFVRTWIDSIAIDRRLIFQVVDGLEDPAAFEAELRMERIRAQLRAARPYENISVGYSFDPERRS